MKRVIALAAALALAGCGSTVQVRSTAQTLTSGGDLGVPNATSGPGSGAGPAAPVRGGSAVPAGPGTTGGSVSVPTAAPGQPSGSDARRSGPGYTATEIRVGFSTSNDAGRALGSLGLSVAVADQEELVRTWVAKVNVEGGIAGRRVVPVFYDYKTTGDTETSDQAACATWTQDSRVFAATGVRAGATGSGDVLTPCLGKADVAWLAGAGDQHKWDQYLRTMYSTTDMSRTREERVLVESLAAQGFFTPGTKVGVVISDNQTDMSRAVREGMEPALRRLGLSITKRVVIANAWTESTNAELQMFAAGVTHVLFAAPGGAAASQFMSAAQSQRRTYEYGISTQDAPGAAVQSLAPAEQLRHARGYGYRPGLDVDASNQPVETPGMWECFGYYRSKGFTTNGLNLAAMSLVCDSLNLLRDALRGVVNPTTGDLSAAVAALGTRFRVASTFTSRFGPRQHDGIGSYRFLAYVADCSCFRYRGGDRSA